MKCAVFLIIIYVVQCSCNNLHVLYCLFTIPKMSLTGLYLLLVIVGDICLWMETLIWEPGNARATSLVSILLHASVSTVCFDRRTLRSWLVSTMFCQTRKMVSKLMKKLRRCLQLYIDLNLFATRRQKRHCAQGRCPRVFGIWGWGGKISFQAFDSMLSFDHFDRNSSLVLFDVICINRPYNMTHDYIWLWHYHCCQ